MDINEYQGEARKTAIYQDGVGILVKFATTPALEQYLRVVYCATKLNGEAGEIAEEVAKAMRDIESPPSTVYYLTDVIDKERKDRILKEVGDIIWYAANIAYELDADLSEVARYNLEKLASRQERGKLHGSGSDR